MKSFLIFVLIAITTLAIPINRNISNLQAGTFTFTNAVNSRSQLYMWQFQQSFESVPQLAYAINSFQLSNTSLVGSFNLITQIINEIGVIISWQRQINRWASLNINYFANTRKDLQLGYQQINFANNHTQDFDINLQTNIIFINSSVVRVYLSGCSCDASTVFDCGVSGKRLTESMLTVSAYLPHGTKNGNLSFTYIIFSPANANFSSYGGMLDRTTFQGSMSIDIRRVIYRTANIIYGFSVLNFSLLSTQNVTLSIDSDMVMSLSSENLLDNLRVIYIAIGMSSKQLCNTPTYGFQYNDQCVSVCPNNTYVMGYNNGGLSCNVCPKKLNLVLTDKGCACAKGFIMLNGTCITSNGNQSNSNKLNNGGNNIQSLLDLFKQMQQGLGKKAGPTPADQTASKDNQQSSTGSFISSQKVSSSSAIIIDNGSTASSVQTSSDNKTIVTSAPTTSSVSTKSSVVSSTLTTTATGPSPSSSVEVSNPSNSSSKVATNQPSISNIQSSKTNNTATISVAQNSNSLTENSNLAIIPQISSSSTSSLSSSSTNLDNSRGPNKIEAQVLANVVMTADTPNKQSNQFPTFQEQPLINTAQSAQTTTSLCTQNAYFLNGRCFCLPGFRNSTGKCIPISDQTAQLMAVNLIQNKEQCENIKQSASQQSSFNNATGRRSRRVGNNSNYTSQDYNSLYEDNQGQSQNNQTYSSRNSPFSGSRRHSHNKYDSDYQNCADQIIAPQNAQLQCPKGYISFNHKCVKCPSTATFDYIQGKCIYFCGQFATYNDQTQRCECQNGYGVGKDGTCGYCSDGNFLLNGYCVRCSDGKIYDYSANNCKCGPGTVTTTDGCINRCGVFQNYDPNTDSCVCQVGFGRVQGKCKLCPSDQRVDSNGLCSPCGLNQKLIKGKCVCSSGYVLRDNVCVPCNQIQSFSFNGICGFCAIGFSYVNKSCVVAQTTNSVAVKKNSIQNSVSLNTAVSVCGNGLIQGRQECDDKNNKNGDGCDSQCRIEAGYTCSRMPSRCIKTGINTKSSSNISTTSTQSVPQATSTQSSQRNRVNNSNSPTTKPVTALKQQSTQSSKLGLTLLGSPNGNSNQIYLTLDTGLPIDFPDQATMLNFLKVKFQGYRAPTFYFSQRAKPQKNLFDCLLIFPSGVPNTKFNAIFSYSSNGSSAQLPIVIDPFTVNSVSSSRTSSRQAAGSRVQ